MINISKTDEPVFVYIDGQDLVMKYCNTEICLSNEEGKKLLERLDYSIEVIYNADFNIQDYDIFPG